MTKSPALPSRSRIIMLTFLAAVASLIVEPVLGVLLPVSPAISLCVVLAVGVSCGPLYGILAGVTAGLLLDVIGSGAIGVNIFAMSIVGYVAGRVSRLMPQWPTAVRVAVASPIFFIVIPAAAVLGKIAGSAPSIVWRPAASFLLMNLFCAVIILPVLSAIRPRT